MLIQLFFFIISVLSSENCSKDLKNLFDSNTAELEKMFYYSGHDLNSLGQYHECNNLPDAKYMLIMINVNLGNFALGICGPQSCDPEDYKNDLKLALNAFRINITHLHLEKVQIVESQKFNNQPMSFATVVSLMFVSVLLGILIIGTVLDYKQEDSDTKKKG